MRSALVLLCMVWLSSGALLERGRLRVLANQHVEVGILPRVGGRVVLLRKPGGPNLLKADSLLWNEPEVDIPKAGTACDFKAYNGHIIWVGPQSGWYASQDRYPVKKARGDNWPPDPYLVYAPYQIMDQSAHHVTMRGPHSPVTGLRLTKRVEIDEHGGVEFVVTARNMRGEAVSWDLWSNTRVGPGARCYVPSALVRRVVPGSGNGDVSISTRRIDGFLALETGSTGSPRCIPVSSKAFIDARDGMVAAFIRDYCFVKTMQPVPREQVHAEHAFVEVYSRTGTCDGTDLLELENHGPFRTLEPGQTMTLKENWRVVEYAGADTQRAHVAFLKRILRKVE